MNKIEIIGNLGSDAMLRDINGKQWLTFSVADSQKRGDSTETTWFNVTSGNTALQPYLTKGKKMFVRGRLTAKTYTTQQGEVRVSMNVWATEIEFCGGGEQQQTQQTVQSQSQQIPAYQQYQQQSQEQPQITAQTGVNDLPF